MRPFAATLKVNPEPLCASTFPPLADQTLIDATPLLVTVKIAPKPKLAGVPPLFPTPVAYSTLLPLLDAAEKGPPDCSAADPVNTLSLVWLSVPRMSTSLADKT